MAMIVITLTNCPISLRGDLSKWLIEINTGVFVGKVSARVRDNLWKRVKDNVRNGKATMVYSTNNEQRMNFRLHNSENRIIDFDGLKLVMKPSPSRTRHLEEKRHGFSKASKIRMGQRMKQRIAKEIPVETNPSPEQSYPDDYVVLDIETTGLREKTDEIMEIGMLKVQSGNTTASFNTLLHTKKSIPRPIEKLTGITNDDLIHEGKELKDMLPQVCDFIGENALVGHNIGFDMRFLNQALQKFDMAKLSNSQYDTMEMYAKTNGSSAKKSLADVVRALQVSEKPCHRAMPDCRAEKEIYEILKNNLKNVQKT
ncbi:type I-E CRISPR-associated endoribonuclease Cas2e [Mitsuokella sp. WILCCON 0060]|uniref:type I-E CRISPR-associated endoribonuclease Cas2e n=1 Tax=Mitsuokella sp. WILCCON 0060 TaxID=3345341 RepID=UPI003F1C2606